MLNMANLEWEAITGPVDNTQSTKEYTFYVNIINCCDIVVFPL